MSYRVRYGTWMLVVLVCLAGWTASAGESQEKPKQPPKPTTHQVKKGPLKIEVKLKGIFEAAQMAEVSLEPEAWTQLQVAKAVEQGARVKKGDPVVWLDLEKIDEAIRKMELDEELAGLAFQQAEESLRAAEKLAPLDAAVAERADKRFAEDYKHYLDFELPYSKKSAKFSIESAEFSLEYTQEELRQLEKMYTEDELTEETEEIILKRARRAVERARHSLEGAQDRYQRTMESTIPRRDEEMKEKAERQAIDHAKAKILLPLQLQQKRLEFEKLKRDRQESAEKLAKLKADRKSMIVKAPIDGVVYYGECVRGHWTTGAALAGVLRKGGGLKPQQIFVTIVQPRPLLARADVPEKELHLLSPGLEAEVVPTGYPDLKLKGKLDAVSVVPIKEGAFDGGLSVTAGRHAAAVMPGMTCSITIVCYEKAEAIAVPAAAVFEEEGRQVVYVKPKDGKPERREVEVGRKAHGKAEILKGLSEGETVLLKKP